MNKVAFYIESMMLGGAEKALLEIVNRLDPSLFDVTIISIFKESVYPTANTYDFASLVNKNIHIITLIDNSSPFLYKMFNRLYANTNKSILYSMLIREKYDIEVAFYEGMPTEFVANSTNNNSDKYAWLHTDNNRLYENATEKYLENAHEIYKKYDCVIGVSENTKDSFLRYFPDIPCMTIYNGVDLSEIREKAKEDCNMQRSRITTFVTVGRIVPVKGYDRLLKAFNRLAEEGLEFSLLIIGDGSEKETLEKYILNNRLEGMVMMLGKQDNPYKYFKLCDAYVCSSLFEGFGLAIVEAMSCGLPILTTDFPGIREIIGGSNNWNICENDEEGLYRILKEVLLNPQRLNDLVPLSITQSEHFNIDRQINAVQQLLLNRDLSWQN